MKTRILSMMFAAAILFGGCSKQVTDDGDVAPQSVPVTFTLATPGSEGVVYPSSRAPQTRVQDAAEYAIKQMTMLVYDATDPQKPKFLRKHTLNDDITLYDNGNGTYSFSIEAPIADINTARKYVFVVNDDAAVAATAAESTEADLHDVKASIELAQGSTADVLAADDKGIVMTGTAKDEGGTGDVLKVTAGLKCKVSLERIVARIDLQNNTPNMTIQSATLVGAATKGYLFAQSSLAAPTPDRISLGSNTNVTITTPNATSDPFQPTTFNKVFYAYERPNTADDYAAVRVTYKINNSYGTVDVPFKKTSDQSGDPIDITRNHLYTIVLGDGSVVETNPIKFSIRVDDWNLVEMPEEIGPGDQLDAASQQKLNEALKVNMFTESNAKEFDLAGKTITSFYSTDMATAFSENAADSYVSWNELRAADNAQNATFTFDGKNYRLPTSGEMALLIPFSNEEQLRYHPWWDNGDISNSDGFHMMVEPFVETLYFKNDAENKPDKTHPADPVYTLKGVSQLKLGDKVTVAEVGTSDPKASYNIHPVYGLRFKDTDQYAAYCWEVKPIAGSDWNKVYLSIKIKALVKGDHKTTLDDVAKDSFWSEGSYIEYKFPAIDGYISDPSAMPSLNADRTSGHMWTSTVFDLDDESGFELGYSITNGNVGHYTLDRYFQLRFVKADPQQ